MLQDNAKTNKQNLDWDWELLGLAAMMLFAQLRAGSISIGDALESWRDTVAKSRGEQ